MKLSQQIHLVIDAIQEHGWVIGPNGWYGNSRNRTPLGIKKGLCLEGAIMAVLDMEPATHSSASYQRPRLETCELYTAIKSYADQKYAKEISWLAAGCSFSCLYMHNDQLFGSQEQVIDFLMECAEYYEKKELREEKEATAGFIGDDPSEIEFEPLHTTPPATEPIPASPEPVETPEKEPVGV